jgi:glutamine amidotransferase
MKKKICILDYGSGNQRSVYNMITFIGHEPQVSSDINVIKNSDYIILPGVGSYGGLMEKLKKKNLIEILNTQIIYKKKLYLGICVGMQIMSTIGEEFERNIGLGWISGVVRKLKAKNNILPHIGWNNIEIKKKNKIFNDINESSNFYFLNSFCFNPDDTSHVLATTKYGESFVSIVQKDNLFGFQFHPEKSQLAGIKIINNFLDQ